MPTTKKRINIVVDDDTYAILKRVASMRSDSLAGTSLHLIAKGLEYREDLHFSRIADSRLSEKQKTILHEEAWQTVFKCRIKYLENVVNEDIPKIPKDARDQIRINIEDEFERRLPAVFRFPENGKPLLHTTRKARELRAKDWRIIYTIEPSDRALIVKIGHRKDAYE